MYTQIGDVMVSEAVIKRRDRQLKELGLVLKHQGAGFELLYNGVEVFGSVSYKSVTTFIEGAWWYKVNAQ